MGFIRVVGGRFICYCTNKIIMAFIPRNYTTLFTCGKVEGGGVLYMLKHRSKLQNSAVLQILDFIRLRSSS